MSLTVSKGQFRSVSPRLRVAAICPAKSPSSGSSWPESRLISEALPSAGRGWSMSYESPHRSLLLPHVLLPDLELCCPSPGLAVSRLSGGIHSPAPALLEAGVWKFLFWSSNQCWTIVASLWSITKLSRIGRSSFGGSPTCWQVSYLWLCWPKCFGQSSLCPHTVKRAPTLSTES